jgi:hypothetical protein
VGAAAVKVTGVEDESAAAAEEKQAARQEWAEIQRNLLRHIYLAAAGAAAAGIGAAVLVYGLR